MHARVPPKVQPTFIDQRRRVSHNTVFRTYGSGLGWVRTTGRFELLDTVIERNADSVFAQSVVRTTVECPNYREGSKNRVVTVPRKL